MRVYNLREMVKGRVMSFGNRLSRARYFRGHGVHSPFVYSMVREVFMRHTLMEGDHSLYEALRRGGVEQKRAIQLQNVALHTHCTTFAINHRDSQLCILDNSMPPTEVQDILRDAVKCGATVVLLDPYKEAAWRALCARIVNAHPTTTVDNRAYLLVFNDVRLPKQHFRI